MHTLLETTNTEAAKITFHVHKNVYWRGKRHKDGDTLATQAQDRADPLIISWLAAGWITDPRAGESAPAAPATKTPPTVSAEKPAKPTAGQIIAAGRGEFVQVPRTLIDPAPYNPRKTFREAKLQELAASIKTDGIIEPLIVRPVAGGRYEIVAGERRWRASGIAWPTGQPTLPCIVRAMDKVTAIRVQGIENLLRDDLNAIEECGWYDALMQEGGYTVKDIMRETGLSEPTIYARLKLKDCPPEIKAAVEADRLPASTAEKVARVEDAQLRSEFARAILHPPKNEPGEEASGVLSFRQAKQWLETAKQRFAREDDWKAKVQGSHLAKSAAKVLTADESDRVVSPGGYVKNPQMYVKPVDICPGDPKQRTYAEVAKEAGRALPAAILARDGHSGKPVVILPREETEKALAGVLPNREEQQRLREAGTERLRREQAQKDAQRKETARRKVERTEQAILACIEHSWSARMDELFLRFAVGAAMRLCRENDEGEMVDALREFGETVTEADADHLNEAWYARYLAACGTPKLRGWLLYFSLRDPLSYSDYAVDEKQLAAAEELFGIEAQPQTSQGPLRSPGA